MEWKILLLAKGFQPESKSILFTDRLLFLKATDLKADNFIPWNHK
jgi:hypothetical protein